jgi:hypothetical protein
MSTPNFDTDLLWPRQVEPDVFPEPYPWCLACGFQHTLDTHFAECMGEHMDGHGMTPEIEAELSRLLRVDPPHVTGWLQGAGERQIRPGLPDSVEEVRARLADRS